MRLAA